MTDTVPDPEPEPAWRRATAGESRWAASIALLIAIACQMVLPVEFTTYRWLVPAIELGMLVWSLLMNPNRIDRHSGALRRVNLALIGVLTLANARAAWGLVDHIVGGQATNAGRLLVSGAAIWVTNMIAFALWYWEFDRGGPGRRSEGIREYPDFLFPQMQNPDLAPKDWEPSFVDYLYLSFTNATAFSPTDVLPMTQWAKLTMLAQSSVSFVTVILVVARAVNTLS